ncbi:MAG: hypothetical protein AB7V26_12930 [Lysobacterales bacterium]
MHFEIIGTVRDVETIARGSGIRELSRLRKSHGTGNWRKRKGVATVKLANGQSLLAEVHWYEATGLGKFEFKIKRLLE